MQQPVVATTNQKRPREERVFNRNTSLFSDQEQRNDIVADGNMEKRKQRKIGEHPETINQVVDQVSTTAYYNLLKAAAVYIDTTKLSNKQQRDKFGTKVMLTIQRNLDHCNPGGGNVQPALLDTPVFTILASSKTDMKTMQQAYCEIFSEKGKKTEKYKVIALGLAVQTGGKLFTSIDSLIKRKKESRSRPSTTPLTLPKVQESISKTVRWKKVEVSGDTETKSDGSDGDNDKNDDDTST